MMVYVYLGGSKLVDLDVADDSVRRWLRMKARPRTGHASVSTSRTAGTHSGNLIGFGKAARFHSFYFNQQYNGYSISISKTDEKVTVYYGFGASPFNMAVYHFLLVRQISHEEKYVLCFEINM
jgi:hypothetical protein